MRPDDLDVSVEELRSWGRAIQKTPTEEFCLEELPFGRQVIAWIDQAILAFLEHGRDEALHYKRAAVIARRATALAKMTREPVPIANYKIDERCLFKHLLQFGCRIKLIGRVGRKRPTP